MIVDLLHYAATWWYAWVMLGLTIGLVAFADWWSKGADDELDELIRWEEEQWQ
jgi:hypothetical protein